MPNTFNVDDFLSDQSVKQSPQGVAPQAAQAQTGMQDSFDVNAFLGDMPAPKAAMPAPAPTKAEPSVLETIGRAAQVGAGTRLQPQMSGALEAGMGAVDQLVTGSNAFGDEGRLSGFTNFLDNYAKARDGQKLQIEEAKKANPKVFAVSELVSSVPRIIAEGVGLKALGLGNLYGQAAATTGLESGMNTASEGGTAGQVGLEALKGAAVGGALAGTASLIGAGVKGVNPTEASLRVINRLAGPEATIAASKVIGNTVSQKVINGAGSLAVLAAGGGATNILLQQPSTWDDSIEAFKNGAGVAASLGLLAKASISMFKWGGKIFTEVEKRGLQREALDQEGVVKSAQKTLEAKKAGIETAKLNKASHIQSVEEAQNALDIAQTQNAKIISMIDQEPHISGRISNLPTFVDRTLQGSLDTLGETINQKIQGAEYAVQSGKTKQAELHGLIEDVLEKIENVNPATRDAEAAKNAARLAVNKFRSSLTTTASEFDPVLNKTVGQNTATATPVKLWNAKKQIQDLIFGQDFLAGSRGTGLRRTMLDFEKGVRESLNSLDASGQLAKYNDAYSNMMNARASFQDEGVNYFLNRASNPNNPKIIPITQQLESHFMDADSLATQGIKGGLKPETAKDPVVGGFVKSLKGTIDAEASQAMTDYSEMLSAKKNYSKIQSEISRSQKVLELAQEKARMKELALTASEAAAEDAASTLSRAEVRLQDLKNPEISGKIGKIPKTVKYLKDVAGVVSEEPVVKATGKGLRGLRTGYEKVGAPLMGARAIKDDK